MASKFFSLCRQGVANNVVRNIAAGSVFSKTAASSGARFLNNRVYSSAVAKKAETHNTTDIVGTAGYEGDSPVEVVSPGDPNKRAFTYFVLGSARFVWASMGRLAVLKLLHSLQASADVLALASVEVDISGINPGQVMTVKWRGKPVFIKHRTQEEIDDALSVNMSELKDPQADADRYLHNKPEWLVVLGVCTHLGCVPLANAGDYNGWFCPCHGSHYDTAARIRKGPAPLNLEMPSYKFLDEEHIVIG
mmetsp:Transcript_36208/g.94172  ORF Transcript_36208/g.94172 Transcript_36208/m.94172 type:complete len:249 (-) Transcript_36208:1568-2314(-)